MKMLFHGRPVMVHDAYEKKKNGVRRSVPVVYDHHLVVLTIP